MTGTTTVGAAAAGAKADLVTAFDTLAEWGLILLAMMLVATGGLYQRRRQ